MKYAKNISLLAAVAFSLLMLAACGQKANCSGITFGGSGGSSGGGGLSGASSSCGPPSNGNGGGGGGGTSYADLVYFVGGGNAIQGAGLTSSGTFSLLTTTSPSIGSGSFAAPDVVIAKQSFLFVPYSSIVNNNSEAFVAGYLINKSTGALTNISGSPFAAGAGPMDAAAVDPQGRFLFVANQTAGIITAFQIDSTTGVLTPSPGSPFVNGTIQPVQMVVDSTGTFLYVSQGDISDNVIEYAIDQNSGALSLINQFTLGTARLRADTTGNFLFSLGRGTAGIDVYSIDPGSGFLTFLATYATDATTYDMAVNPSGTLLYAFGKQGRLAEPLQGYSLDVNGVLTPLAGSPFTTVPGQFAGQFDPTGTHVFATTATGFTVLTVDPNTGVPSNPTPDITVASTPAFAVTN
jgi:lactonase family protein with 7-bladed beta-propeller